MTSRRQIPNLRLIVAAVVMTLLACFASAQNGTANTEPVTTKARDETNSKAVSRDLARLIATSSHIDFRELESSAPLDAWFRAVDISLGKVGETDLLVWGEQPWLKGADNDWYWIVRSGAHPQVLLYAAPSSSLEVLQTKTNGYADLRISWQFETDTNERVYRFTKGEYRLRQDKWAQK